MKFHNERHHNITQFVLSNFLACGGCIRWPREHAEDAWVIWEGLADPENGKTGQATHCEPSSSRLCIYHSNFFLSTQSAFRPQKWVSLSAAEFSTWLSQGKRSEPSPKRQWDRMTDGPGKEQFRSSFLEIQKRIEGGVLEKAVPVSFMTSEAPLGPEEHLELIQRLIEAPPELHPYGNWQAGSGFLGATPEILFHLKGRQLNTMALAGTAPLTLESGIFLNDPKERAEHHFVVKNMMEVLKPMGTFEAMSTQVLRLPTLQHLKTEISVQLRDEMSWASLLQAMHPTAALGTYPREQWRWLEELPDQRARGSFGAPFGVQLDDGRLLALVGIRQVQWNLEKMRIGAGCGLVKESVFEREWKELLLKIDSVQRNFGWN